MRDCDEIFAVCNIARAVSDVGVVEVFNLARSASLKNVGIICTKSDVSHSALLAITSSSPSEPCNDILLRISTLLKRHEIGQGKTQPPLINLTKTSQKLNDKLKIIEMRNMISHTKMTTKVLEFMAEIFDKWLEKRTEQSELLIILLEYKRSYIVISTGTSCAV
jgi:hypothetical protein